MPSFPQQIAVAAILALSILAGAPASVGQEVNGCTITSATDWLDTGPMGRTIDFACCSYTPPCVKIQPGRTVRWLGDFTFHPLRPGLVVGNMTQTQAGNPIPSLDSGTNSGQITFPNPGGWGFYCNFHWNTSSMYGTVFVALFADGFESHDTTAWSSTVP